MRTIAILFVVLALTLGSWRALAAKDAGKTANELSPEDQSESNEKHGEGVATPSPSPTPSYRKGRSLGGHFDISVLRDLRRLKPYFYPVNELTTTIGRTRPCQFRFAFSVQFGAEAGMAEFGEKRDQLFDELKRTIQRFEPQTLLTPGGKERLRAELTRAINRRLATARVRNLYFTDFLIAS